MICPNCQKNNAEAAKFCVGCGAVLNANTSKQIVGQNSTINNVIIFAIIGVAATALLVYAGVIRLPFFGKSPAQVTKKSMETLINKDYDGFIGTLDSDSMSKFMTIKTRIPATTNMTFSDFMDIGMKEISTKKGVKRIDVLKEEVNGDTAQVCLKLAFGDGSLSRDDENCIDLVKENGDWKIKIDLQDRMPNVGLHDTGLTSNDYVSLPDIPSPQTAQVAENGMEQIVNSDANGNEKTSRPSFELFVMSYCPYGLQAEKAYLPVYRLIGDKADMKIRFVNYAMHGKKEIDENLRQYCIQKNQTNLFADYLDCFVHSQSPAGVDSVDYASCLRKAGIDPAELDSCVSSTDASFGIEKDYNDKSSWLSGAYPGFAVDNDLNVKYGVQGSPTFVINGKEAEIETKSPQALLNALCTAFNNPPAECRQTFSIGVPSLGFGD